MNWSREDKTAWFLDAHFGMSVHFGLFSVLGRGERVMYEERIPNDEYAALADRFRPERFDADLLVRTALEAGCRYMVFTARHHDGFCMYDSKVSDFTSVKTAAKCDFVAEYTAACRRHGMKIGLYYAWSDWRYRGFWNARNYPESAAAMGEQARAQIAELMTNYGEIDILWYDGFTIPGLSEAEVAGVFKPWEINERVYALQPRILINNRCGSPMDFDTPEQVVADSGPGRAWETCMTTGDPCGWGYVQNNHNQKPVSQLLQHLCNCAAHGGNLLLGFGPRGDGSLPEVCTERFAEIGRWLRENGAAIYGSQRCEFNDMPLLGYVTQSGDTAYICTSRWPGSDFVLAGLYPDVTQISLPASGRCYPFKYLQHNRIHVYGTPEHEPDPYVTVIALKFRSRPMRAVYYP